MELDDLLEKEGLDATSIEAALAWARGRAAELVRGVGSDPELGPLLEGLGSSSVGEDTSTSPSRSLSMGSRPPPPSPMYSDLRGLQAAFLAEEGELAAELPDVGAVLRVFKKARTGPSVAARPVASTSDEVTSDEVTSDEVTGPAVADGEPASAGAGEADAAPEQAAVDAALVAAADGEPSTAPAEGSESESEAPELSGAAAHGLPAPPEADLDPLAGIDFDDLPGLDEDDEEDDHTHVDLPSPIRASAQGFPADHDARITMVPSDGSEMTLPSMQAPLNDASLKALLAEDGQPSGELTERALNPLLGAPAEPSGDSTVTSRAADPSPSPDDTVVPSEAPAAVEASAKVVEIEEIEMLDDDDLVMFEEEEDEEVPEWKQALVSAQLDAEAAPVAPPTDETTDPSSDGAADSGTPPADEGQDVDLGDL